ncbi:hypothetical protein Hanom_Chr12g01155261 [Helianthus anomalus]
MALREGECFLVRRVADRGIDKNIGDSRVRGDRLNCDRRSTNRGNEIRNRDPRDIIKIQRLRQRVRDIEEIKQFRQRVRVLELRRDMRVKETESGTIVRDNVNEEEEHPFAIPTPGSTNQSIKRFCRKRDPDSMKTELNPMKKNVRWCKCFLAGLLVKMTSP